MVRGRKEKGTPRIRANRHTSPRAGISWEFPSLKMKAPLNYRGIMQRNVMFVFELDPKVKAYKPNPFILRAIGSDGTLYEHTPDFRV